MSESARPTAQLLVSALQRAAFARGGFAVVRARGDPVAGTILVICAENGREQRVLERFPDWSRGHVWTSVWPKDSVNQLDIQEYLEKRRRSDPDLWLLELDIADAEQLVVQIGGGA